MPVRKKSLISTFVPLFLTVTVLWVLAGCSTTDKYHNKRHIDTIMKDLDSAHRDIDRVFGLDEPSPLVEK